MKNLIFTAFLFSGAIGFAQNQTVVFPPSVLDKPETISIPSLELLGKIDVYVFKSHPDFSVDRRFGAYNWADAAHQLDDYRFMADALFRVQDNMGRDLIHDAITPEMLNRLKYKQFP